MSLHGGFQTASCQCRKRFGPLPAQYCALAPSQSRRPADVGTCSALPPNEASPREVPSERAEHGQFGLPSGDRAGFIQQTAHRLNAFRLSPPVIKMPVPRLAGATHNGRRVARPNAQGQAHSTATATTAITKGCSRSSRSCPSGSSQRTVGPGACMDQPMRVSVAITSTMGTRCRRWYPSGAEWVLWTLACSNRRMIVARTVSRPLWSPASAPDRAD